MKKTLLLSVLLIGAASASQAGVRFGFGFGLPLPLPVPSITITQPAPVCEPAPPPVCYAPPAAVYQAPVVIESPRAYVGFSSDGYGRQDRYYQAHEQNRRDYSHNWNHSGRQQREEHSRDGHRW